MRLLSLALLLAPAVAAAATAPLPDGFDVVPRHELVPAVWSTTSGESPNATNRASIEQICAMKRAIEPTTPTPVFEADMSRPDTVTIVHVTSPQGWASYETARGAVCDPASMGASRDVCGCTFRVMTTRWVHIRRTRDGVFETLDVEVNKGTATRRTRRAGPPDAAPSAPATAAFGTVVGHDEIAGMPCSVYRQDRATSRTERCLADRVDAVPAALQLQALSTTTFLIQDGTPVRRDWRRTDRIDADAQVDIGVFDVPAGIRVLGR